MERDDMSTPYTPFDIWKSMTRMEESKEEFDKAMKAAKEETQKAYEELRRLQIEHREAMRALQR